MHGSAHDAVTHLAPAIESLTGYPADPAGIARFRRYLALLMDWNKTHRLTGYRSAEAVVRQLFLDALLFLARLPSGALTMIDLGTGPGIPGVPIRVVRSDISLTVVESRRKQVSFLAALKRGLDLQDIVILEGRAEKLLIDYPALVGGFDVAVTRAVGTRMIPTAMRYLKPGGLFVAGGPPVQTEAGRTEMEEAGWVRRETVAFPRLGMSRVFLIGLRPP